ncbi:hypothetical protein GETHOR_17880 [Geothrix oryzae]|uniref:Tetratricopeptide repeat protein n=1 Tax=Geothrix oryzae TaxID=2927975 RepID=A0ABN6UXT2_9BACT|nr:hypothetical protein [Geothrix oryzae]BDU69687.1 hypothetical protein GETHOR_17880 [Geothrix oryzae]
MLPWLSSPMLLVALTQQSAQLPPMGNTPQERSSQVVRLEQAKDYKGLAAHARAWIDQHPDDAEAWTSLGVAQFNLHEEAGALESLSKAVTLKPDLKRAWYILGQIHHQRHDQPATMNCYHQLQKLDAGLARHFYRNVLGRW